MCTCPPNIGPGYGFHGRLLEPETENISHTIVQVCDSIGIGVQIRAQSSTCCFQPWQNRTSEDLGYTRRQTVVYLKICTNNLKTSRTNPCIDIHVPAKKSCLLYASILQIVLVLKDSFIWLSLLTAIAKRPASYIHSSLLDPLRRSATGTHTVHSQELEG